MIKWSKHFEKKCTTLDITYIWSVSFSDILVFTSGQVCSPAGENPVKMPGSDLCTPRNETAQPVISKTEK
jgi:hypothetical protein